MPVAFPHERFARLGFFDTTFGDRRTRSRLPRLVGSLAA